jgi:hypothetical protein
MCLSVCLFVVHDVKIFDKLIADGPNQPTHSMAFIILLSQFPENATPYDPKERDRIGEACVHLAHQMIGKITERVRDIINHIAIQYITIDNYVCTTPFLLL